MQRGQAPMALTYDFKMKTPYSDSVALQFSAMKISTKGTWLNFQNKTPRQ